MSLTLTYDGSVITPDFRPSTISIPVRAHNGEAETGVIPVEDADATLTIVGHRPFIVEESACSQPRLFTGWTVVRGYAREREKALIVEAQRATEINIVDANAMFGFRLISGDDGN